MIATTLLFFSFIFVSEKYFPHEVLLYQEDDGTYTQHFLPRDTVFDENGMIRYEIFDIYGW